MFGEQRPQLLELGGFRPGIQPEFPNGCMARDLSLELKQRKWPSFEFAIVDVIGFHNIGKCNSVK